MKRCSHIFRSGPLHPSIKIGGGMSMGRCENECVPELVFCVVHAEKEAMALVIHQYKKKIEQLQEELQARDKKPVGRRSPRRRTT